MPLLLNGVVAEGLTLKGAIGALIQNPPGRGLTRTPVVEAVAVARAFYAEVHDYALDLREAVFTAFPSLRYGPPGHLILRDLDTLRASAALG